MEFIGFPKIARWSRELVITEKIDGTNGVVYIKENLDHLSVEYGMALGHLIVDDKVLSMYVGSRTRWLTVQNDNHGFCRWCHENMKELFKLGEGRHFGEWWGLGINRGYGLKEKRFSLFNTSVWNEQTKPGCCHVVPVLYQGPIEHEINIDLALWNLTKFGSVAAPGFMKPEGIVIYHTAGNVSFKKTIEGDEFHKGEVKNEGA